MKFVRLLSLPTPLLNQSMELLLLKDMDLQLPLLVNRFQDKSAPMFPSRSAQMFLSRSAEMFPDKSARTCQNRWPSRSAEMCPEKSASQCLNK